MTARGGSITRRAEEIQVALSGLRTQLYERRRDRKYHPSQVANSVRQQIQPYQLYPHAVRSISCIARSLPMPEPLKSRNLVYLNKPNETHGHQRPAPFRHEGPAWRPYLGSKEPGRTWRSEASLPKKGRAMPGGTIAYLLKFAPKEAYIDDLLKGHLYMNAAEYYNGLPGEQGDPLEASMVLPACIYGNYRLPIYCMYTVRENNIVDNTVKIPIRMIRESGAWTGESALCSTTASRASPTDTSPKTETCTPTAPSPTASPGQN